MDDIRATLSSTWGKYSYSYILTDKELTWRWTNGKDSGELHKPLADMNPRVNHSTSRPKGAEPNVYGGITIIALAVVVYFSVLQTLVPLLSPFIMIAGTILLIRGLKTWHVETYTHFMMRDGQSFAYVVHRHCNAQQLEQFEAEYESACDSAKFLEP